MEKMEVLNKYVLVRVGSMEYGVSIDQVNSLDRVTTVHKMPKAAEYVRGFVEYRDRIVTAVDLGIMLGMEAIGDTLDTRMMYVNASESETIGVFVDAALEVIEIEESKISGADDLDISMLPGMRVAHLDRGLVMVLDVVRLMETMKENRVSSRLVV